MVTESEYITREMVYIGPSLARHEGMPWPFARLRDKVYSYWLSSDEIDIDEMRELMKRSDNRNLIYGVAVDMQRFVYSRSSELSFLEDRLGVWWEEKDLQERLDEIPKIFRRSIENV